MAIGSESLSFPRFTQLLTEGFFSFFLFIDLREREKKGEGGTQRNINFLFLLFMHSFVDSCI